MVAIKNITRALCTTPMCLQLADDYIKNLSPNYKDIDPCTNFEEMVCGGWRRRHETPATLLLDVITLIEGENNEMLRAIVEGLYPTDFSAPRLGSGELSADQENFEKIKLAYNACMDEDGLEKLGIAPITDLVNQLGETFGGDNWSQTLLFTELLNIWTLVSPVVSPDYNIPERQIVTLNSAESTVGLSLPSRDFYTNTSMLMDEYVPIVANILGAVLGNGSTSDNFTERARQLVVFETRLADISTPKSVSFHEVATKGSLSEADKLAPQLGLLEVYAALAPPDKPPGDILWNKEYIGNLSRLLEDTPRSAIESYFTWRVILETKDHVLANEIFHPFHTFTFRILGVNIELDRLPRWRTCLNSVRDNLGWILSGFFVKRLFSQRDFNLASQVISDVRTAYAQKLSTLPWLDGPTRDEAMDKLHLLIQKVGYPTANPNLTDPESLREYYSSLRITSSYFDNVRQASASAARRSFQALGKPTDRASWSHSHAVTVNAFYRRDINDILVPAGYLQLPRFGGDLPSAVNYGAFGSTAGHEITHGFDKLGRNFDSTGRLVNWWSEEVLAEYERREQCFVEQFGNMTVYANAKNASGTGYKMDGLQSLLENEADSAGLVAAYDAWLLRRKLDGDKEEPALPGLEEWTDEQLFFLAFGNSWCSMNGDDMLKLSLQLDRHAPDWVRIMGSTANSRAFKEAFACKVKEPTCELW